MKAGTPHLVAGKAPWQTAHYVCRLARCACRSSSQKVLRYFLGALYARASFPQGGSRGKTEGEPPFLSPTKKAEACKEYVGHEAYAYR